MFPETERTLHAFHALKHAHALFGRPAELPPGEFFVLDRVGHLRDQTGEVNVSDLHAGVRLTMSAVSQIVAQLERKGLVTRVMSAADRRRIVVSITPEGEALLGRAHRMMDEIIGELMERMGERDAEQLVELLLKLGRVIEQMRLEKAASSEEEDTCLD